MKQYNEYKDSSVKWIGEIPKHWDAIRIKFIGKTLGGLTYSPDDVCSPEEGIIVLRSSNIKNNELSFYDNVYVKKELQDKDFIKQGDLLICSRNGSADLVGKCAIIDKPINASFGAFMMVLRPSMTLNSKYVYYISQVCIDKYKATFKTSTINQLTNSLLGNIYSPYTYSEHEQKAIVSYLDEKVSKIDRYISTAEKKIAALDELKQVTIADAVTHGINPNAPMINSGIPWIGMVPEHWTRARYKDILNIEDEKVGKRNDLTLLSLTKRGVLIRDLSEGKGKFPKDYESYKVVNPNNIILCLFDVDETPRTVGISHNKGMITGAYDIFEIRNVKLEYIYYLYLSIDDKKGFKSLYKGLRKVIPLPSLLSAYINLPPISEQNKIVAYIDRKVAQIDKMKAAELAQIDKLKEYKQRLISDVVTGKVKVTNE